MVTLKTLEAQRQQLLLVADGFFREYDARRKRLILRTSDGLYTFTTQKKGGPYLVDKKGSPFILANTVGDWPVVLREALVSGWPHVDIESTALSSQWRGWRTGQIQTYEL